MKMSLPRGNFTHPFQTSIITIHEYTRIKNLKKCLELLEKNPDHLLAEMQKRLSDAKAIIAKIINKYSDLSIGCLELEDFREFIKLVDPDKVERLTIGYAPYDVSSLLTKTRSPKLLEDMEKLAPTLDEFFKSTRFPKLKFFQIKAPTIPELKGLPQYIERNEIRALDIFTCDLLNISTTMPYLEELNLRYVYNTYEEEWCYILAAIKQSEKIKKLSLNLPPSYLFDSECLFDAIKSNLESIHFTHYSSNPYSNPYLIKSSFGLNLEKIINDPSYKLRNIKLPVTLMDCNTSKILCKILQTKPSVSIDLQLLSMSRRHCEPDFFGSLALMYKENGIVHNPVLILLILCLNVQNQQFQSAYATKNLSCINSFFKNCNDNISVLKEFLDIVEQIDIGTRSKFDDKFKIDNPLRTHIKEISHIYSAQQIKTYAKSSALAKDMLCQQADDRYQKYIEYIFNLETFQNTTFEI